MQLYQHCVARLLIAFDTCLSLLFISTSSKTQTFSFAEESLLLVCHRWCRLLLEQVVDGEDADVGKPGQVHGGGGSDAPPGRRHHGLCGRGPSQGTFDQGG